METAKRILSEEHPGTLTSIANLASIGADLGKAGRPAPTLALSLRELSWLTRFIGITLLKICPFIREDKGIYLLVILLLHQKFIGPPFESNRFPWNILPPPLLKVPEKVLIDLVGLVELESPCTVFCPCSFADCP